MGLYILKSVLCLSVCLCFYHLVLEQEKAHKTKRYFLLASLVLSFLVPLITFTSYEYVEPISDPTTLLTLADGEDAAVNKANTSLNIILGIYCLGVAVYLIRFLINLNKIRVSILQHNTVKNNIYTAVLVLKRIVPHSFFNYIFINKDAYTTNAIPAEVFQHEEAHIKQKHSLDLLFIEVLQIIFWFNPLLYFTKKAIKLNHEFLADEAVVNQHKNIETYQHLLVNFSSNPHQVALSSSFNYSLTKKRILMLSKSSSKLKWLRLFAILPLLAGLLFSFSSRETIYKTMLVPTENVASNTTKVITKNLSQEKQIVLSVNENTIKINNKEVALENVTDEINKITKGWSKQELIDPNIKVSFKNVPKNGIANIELAFKASRLGKANPKKSFILPPPPPPPAPPKQATKELVPPPPPPPLSPTQTSGQVEINGKEHYFVKDGESIRYFNRFAGEVDKEGTPLDPEMTEERIKALEKLHEERQKLSKEEKHLKKSEKRLKKFEAKVEDHEKKRAELLKEKSEKQREAYEKAMVKRAEAIEKRSKKLEDRKEYITKRYKDNKVVEVYDVSEADEMPPIPPLPPTPPTSTPTEIIKNMSKAGATFYLEEKEITPTEALEIVAKDKDINMLANPNAKHGKYVKLSKAPISISN